MDNLSAILLIFSTHYIADYLLQTRHIAINKSIRLIVMLEHLFVYAACILLITSMIRDLTSDTLYFTLCLTIFHGVQDWFLWRGYKAFRKDELEHGFRYWEDKVFYDFIGMDNVLHFNTIIILYWIFLWSSLKSI